MSLEGGLWLVYSDGTESDSAAQYGIARTDAEGNWTWQEGLGRDSAFEAVRRVIKRGLKATPALGGLYGDSRDNSFLLTE
jgi:hypothetical protein